MENQKIAIRVSVATIGANLLLAAFKLFAGIYARSGAMVSDAAHSASDVFTTLVVIIGVKLAGKAADKEHPYGHERMESVSAMILSVVLAGVGIGMGYSAILKILGQAPGGLSVPGTLALFAALVSILAKEGMFWYTRAAARKTSSSALMADAWHHRSDAMSSVGSFAGILGARLGLPILDPLASVAICALVVKAAFDIFMDGANQMMDCSCDDLTLEKIRDAVARQQGVLGVDRLKTRLFGDKIYVDVEIRADGSSTLSQAHQVAQEVHDAVETKIPRVKHCMVHVNPEGEEDMAALGDER